MKAAPESAFFSKIMPDPVPPPFSIRTTPVLTRFIIETKFSEAIGVAVGISILSAWGVGDGSGIGVGVGDAVGDGDVVGDSDGSAAIAV